MRVSPSPSMDGMMVSKKALCLEKSETKTVKLTKRKRIAVCWGMTKTLWNTNTVAMVAMDAISMISLPIVIPTRASDAATSVTPVAGRKNDFS